MTHRASEVRAGEDCAVDDCVAEISTRKVRLGRVRLAQHHLREYTRSGHQSKKGRENIRVCGWLSATITRSPGQKGRRIGTHATLVTGGGRAIRVRLPPPLLQTVGYRLARLGAGGISLGKSGSTSKQRDRQFP
eukprot:6998899-Pyramimonas_sp.AAC.1